ncbi:Serine/threonine protein kinase [Giardia duodenalis]|uniref:non-specific serine/threonine protein kinase n=2 Tax=Giardia intestinalis TaxID=5741 RepID=V6TZ65_GIAIN|nr:Serine/threonine protein kinase [Giardia intestinalis]
MTVSIEWFFFTKMTNQILAGVLQLERILATGEHSIIYQCTDLRTGSTHICKKICYSRFNQSEEDALNYELTVAHRVTHGNVVAYLDVIHDKPCETYYIVMPFYRFYDLGTQICRKIEDGSRFEETCVWLVLLQCLLALDYFDTQLSSTSTHKDATGKIAFGDVRPTSIYVDLQGNTFINTFRLSKYPSFLDDLAALKLVPYWAPERLMSHQYDSKTDIWSVGCTIYEMCLLHSLFRGTCEDVLEQVQKLKRPIKLPHYSAQLEEIVNTMLEPSPDKRPSAAEFLKNPTILEYKRFYDEQVNFRKLALGYQVPQKGLCKICGGNGLDCCEIVRLAVANSKRLSYVDENGNLVYVDTLAEQKAGIARVANQRTVERIYSIINPDSRKANYFNIQSVTKDMIHAKQQASYAWNPVQKEGNIKAEDTRSIIMNSVKDMYKYNEQRNYFPRERCGDPGTYPPASMVPVTLIRSAENRHAPRSQLTQKPYNKLDQWSYEGVDTINFQTQYSEPQSWICSGNTDMREAPSIVSNTEEQAGKHNNAPSYRLAQSSCLSSTGSHLSPIDEFLSQVRSASPPKPVCKDFVPLVYASSPTPPPSYQSINDVPVTKVTTEYELFQPSTHTLLNPSMVNISPANVSVQSLVPTNSVGSNIYRSRPELKPASGLDHRSSMLATSVVPSQVSTIYQNDSFMSPANSVYRDSALSIPSVNPASEYMPDQKQK